MSRVFVALETSLQRKVVTSLQRKVVVKVLLSVERFRREIYLAASRGSRDKFLRRRALLNFA
jgi:spore coat polysaccharide biosynthesis protein SpsF (cytidylyltransferase family)